jgi:hypothetical protein
MSVITSMISPMPQQHLTLACCPCVQVLGLTNYSHWDRAAEMRSCMVKHDDIAGKGCLCQGHLCVGAAEPQTTATGTGQQRCLCQGQLCCRARATFAGLLRLLCSQHLLLHQPPLAGSGLGVDSWTIGSLIAHACLVVMWGPINVGLPP